jgi:outer membrane lipoprotein carrier protein LolA
MLLALAASWRSAPPTEGAAAEVEAPAESAITKDELLALLREVPGVSARYREVQYIALLAAPLESSGTMHFAPPTRLAKRQLAPNAAAMVVDGRKLRFADAFGNEAIDLAANPAVALFVDSFVDVLAGDEEALARTWAMGFTAGADGDPRAWALALRPRVAPATKLVERIVLRGRNELVQQIEVDEIGGDRTITKLTEIDTHHRYDQAEAARIFTIALR